MVVTNYNNLYDYYHPARLELVTVPHVHTSDHEYATLEAFYNRSYYARTLPPVPKDCPTPFGVAGNQGMLNSS